MFSLLWSAVTISSEIFLKDKNLKDLSLKQRKNFYLLPDLPPEVLHIGVVEAFSRADRIGRDPRGESVQLLNSECSCKNQQMFRKNFVKNVHV
jgi:hypothetical protein